MKIILLTFIILTINGFTYAQTPFALDKIKEVKLLESNRDDVKKIFNDYKTDDAQDSGEFDFFYTDNAEIRVTYSEGNCDEGGSESFNVPRGKATYIKIILSSPVKPEDIEVDLSKYKKEKWYHDIADTYAYYDKNAGLLLRVRRNKIEEISFLPSPNYYHRMCDQERAKILSSTSSIFDLKLKDRIAVISEVNANVTKLNLSRTKITAGCSLSNAAQTQTCSNSNKIIYVSTKAIDPEKDVLRYDYTVSGGRIIGTGAQVIWDLTSVKAGTYKITVAVDDGCGFCGITKTKTIIVKECSKCR